MPRAKTADLIETFFKANPKLNPEAEDAEEVIHAVWSIPSLEPFMDMVAFEGEGYRLIDSNAWIQEGKTEPNVPLPNNPTWTDLRKAVEAGIAQSGDTHHVFIEGFEINYTDKTVEACMGS